MNISGIRVKTLPDRLAALRADLAALPWAEAHQSDAAGRLIVTVEGADIAEALTRLQAIRELPGVLAADMLIHYCDDGPVPTAEPGAPAPEDILNDTAVAAPQSHYRRLKSLAGA